MSEYKIIVSEPWDYDGPAGANLIEGDIIKVFSPRLILFKSDHLLDFEDVKGTILILSPRYEGQILTPELQYEGTVGGAIVLLDDYEDKNEAFLEANCKYVLIGSLKAIATK